MFKIGDRVVIAVSGLMSELKKGYKGIVVNLRSMSVIGVEWESLTHGHNCDGSCRNGKGFYVRPDEIKLEQETIFVVNESGEYKEVYVGT